MNPARTILLSALLGIVFPLSAQFVNEAGDVKLLVPRAPFVKTPITKLLLLSSKESDSALVLKALQAELSRQAAIKVVLPEETDALAAGIAGLDTLKKEQQEGIAAKYGTSHLMWVRLERFNFKDGKSTEVIRTASGTQYRHKWIGSVTGVLHCPVLELATGAVTTLTPQNVQKQYYKESELSQPAPENSSTARNDLVELAARKALQMVVTIHAMQTFPFMTQGELGTVLKSLKAGNLDEALAKARELAVASGNESAKYQARIQYDLGLLLCLKARPSEALVALQSAEKAGYDKAEVQKLLEACRSLLSAQTPRP